LTCGGTLPTHSPTYLRAFCLGVRCGVRGGGRSRTAATPARLCPTLFDVLRRFPISTLTTAAPAYAVPQLLRTARGLLFLRSWFCCLFVGSVQTGLFQRTAPHPDIRSACLWLVGLQRWRYARCPFPRLIHALARHLLYRAGCRAAAHVPRKRARHWRHAAPAAPTPLRMLPANACRPALFSLVRFGFPCGLGAGGGGHVGSFWAFIRDPGGSFYLS